MLCLKRRLRCRFTDAWSRLKKRLRCRFTDAWSRLKTRLRCRFTDAWSRLKTRLRCRFTDAWSSLTVPFYGCIVVIEKEITMPVYGCMVVTTTKKRSSDEIFLTPMPLHTFAFTAWPGPDTKSDITCLFIALPHAVIFEECWTWNCMEDREGLLGLVACHPMDQCSCKMDDGKILSLWDIDSRSNTKPRFEVTSASTSSIKYEFNPCTGFSIANSKCKDALLCQTVTGPSSQSVSTVLALAKSTPTVAYDENEKKYSFRYVAPDLVTETLLFLSCEKTLTTPRLSQVSKIAQGPYLTTLVTKCACPGTCSYSPNGSTSSGSKKLSTGSILCITLLVLVVVYLVGGVIFNKFHLQKEGSDVIPNKSFWTSLPPLAKDGFVFVSGKIRGTKSSEYQSI
eukprot:gene3091-3557_t